MSMDRHNHNGDKVIMSQNISRRYNVCFNSNKNFHNS